MKSISYHYISPEASNINDKPYCIYTDTIISYLLDIYNKLYIKKHYSFLTIYTLRIMAGNPMSALDLP